MFGPFKKLGVPKHFYRFSNVMIPWVLGLSVALLFIGMLAGLVLAPADYQQGDAFRIMYIHVPSAILAMGIYVMMASSAFVSLVWRIKVAALWMNASAKIGACFAFLALFTGAVWGKPMWGTWWIWDARLTSTLILLFLYLGVIALQSAIHNPTARDKAGALLALVGVMNIPIIHFSVDWWNTLHQGASITRFQKPAIDPAMLYPLLIMIMGCFLLYVGAALLRVRCLILEREKRSHWLKEEIAR